MSTGSSMLPTFSISDQTKADIIWLARDAGVSLDRALRILVEIYRLQQANGNDFGDLETILYLRTTCETTAVGVSELREALSLFSELQERGLTLDDIRTTLKVAEDLASLVSLPCVFMMAVMLSVSPLEFRATSWCGTCGWRSGLPSPTCSTECSCTSTHRKPHSFNVRTNS